MTTLSNVTLEDFVKGYNTLYPNIPQLTKQERDSGLKMLSIMYLNLDQELSENDVEKARRLLIEAYTMDNVVNQGAYEGSKWPLGREVYVRATRKNPYREYDGKGTIIYSTNRWAKVEYTHHLTDNGEKGMILENLPEDKVHIMCFLNDEMELIEDE